MSTVIPEIGEVAAMTAVRNNNYESIKPWLDRVLALPLLLITSPIILFFRLVMRWDTGGSGIYAQDRLGLGGKVFTIYKIRTMYKDSERHSGATWSLPGDPRITPIGRILRWCHIDELPQLVNVLKGEMSLVGPRPERPELIPPLERAFPEYRQRLLVRPGLTGLAQVQQPPDTSLSSVGRKLNYDLCYVERMSFWLDIRLILGTVLKCAGVPFTWIGRILQLPDPNIHLSSESDRSEPELSASTLVSNSYSH
jgi:lipopolysaccharide/colanic/teichoic acid biosynthesis glycosyltransferase